MSNSHPRLQRDDRASYRIRVQGALDPKWSNYLGSLAITIAPSDEQGPVTTLAGELTDQAALMGVLNSVYDMGFILLYVECLAYDERAV